MLIGGVYFFADDDLVPIKRRRLEATAADRQLLSDASFFTAALPDLQKHEALGKSTPHLISYLEPWQEMHMQPSPLWQETVRIVMPKTTYCEKKKCK